MKKCETFAWAILALGLCLNLTACDDDDDDSVSSKAVALYVGDLYTVDGDISSAESENDFIASVSQYGIITGEHVGETKIKINGKTNIPVTVKGKYSIYPDPILDWNLTKSEIIEKEKNGTLQHDEDDELQYFGFGSATYLQYYFNEDGKLREVILLVPSNIVTQSEITSYLKERYSFESSVVYLYRGYDANYKEDATTVVSVIDMNWLSSSYEIVYEPVE